MAELMDILAKAFITLPHNTDLTVPTGAWVPIPFNTEGFSRGTAITVDTANNALVVNESGPYSFSIFVNAAFDRTEEIMLTTEINGTASSIALSEQGRGANKPVDFSWFTIATLVAGDVVKAILSMEATETEVTILSANMLLSKEF
jgi:hypothetical protein